MFDQRITEDPKENNKVTIYVWETAITGREIGHVSLKTPNDYISLYPKERTEAVKARIGDQYRFQTYDEDMKEQKLPYIITLNSLDANAIETAFERFKSKKSQSNFSLWGSSYFKKDNTTNCGSLIAYLLVKGGIHRLVPNLPIDQNGDFDSISFIKRRTLFPLLVAITAYGELEPILSFVPSYLSTPTKASMIALAILSTALGFLIDNCVLPNDIKDIVEKAKEIEEEEEKNRILLEVKCTL